MLDLDRGHLERHRILAPDGAGIAGPAFRLLRTQVLQRLDQLGANAIAIVSPRAGDGKTFTAINLAISIALDPTRTALLVDFDLRRPSVHRMFGIAPRRGVEACVAGECELPEVLLRLTGYARLAVLPCAVPNAGSSELLAAPRTRALVDEIRSRYANRIVVFDLPPALEADDALMFAPLVGAMLMVVSEDRTRRDDVLRSLHLLRGTTMIGTVLNQSSEAQRSRY